ncbi:30S ribosomal protein S16 [Spiroplasma sp. TIUS-1]|uniref:30S ribosomal protein S16 n=1 Tax=Spiroplasma sp. TIUS-1 TaxID=216963 RepID=UPI001398EC7E|nr:30S ribosomal protein S16 [Spiroplasma sp. TIUS-1]QHX35850.1 30S ribosomal protein S16 [Spiroplasma sp. TIUS-1]
MVKLRLRRAGKKRAAFFRIVATDSRVQRDGIYIDLIGTYNPINGETKINEEIALKWLADGAQPTDTVRDILSKHGIMKKFHDSKLDKPAKAKKAVVKKPAAKKPATVKKPTTAKPATAKKPAAKPAAAKAPAKK